MNQSKGEQLVAEAKKIARRVDSWISLSNALTDPNGGLISRFFPEMEERQAFLASSEYEEINQLLRGMIERQGLYPRAAHDRKASRH
jgi:hypothetical protein